MRTMPLRPPSRSPITCRRVARGVSGLRIGVPRAFVGEGVDADVQQAFAASLDRWRAAGAVIVDIELPHARHAIPVYYLIATAEASSNLARYDGVRYGHRATLEKGDGCRRCTTAPGTRASGPR